MIRWIPQIVHQDQVGFIPSREARDNVRRTLNVVQRAHFTSTPLMLLATDAEQAFDRVSLSFLEQMIIHIGITEKMLAWIYSHPSAQLSVNGTLALPFTINNGT